MEVDGVRELSSGGPDSCTRQGCLEDNGAVCNAIGRGLLDLFSTLPRLVPLGAEAIAAALRRLTTQGAGLMARQERERQAAQADTGADATSNRAAMQVRHLREHNLYAQYAVFLAQTIEPVLDNEEICSKLLDANVDAMLVSVFEFATPRDTHRLERVSRAVTHLKKRREETGDKTPITVHAVLHEVESPGFPFASLDGAIMQAIKAFGSKAPSKIIPLLFQTMLPVLNQLEQLQSRVSRDVHSGSVTGVLDSVPDVAVPGEEDMAAVFALADQIAPASAYLRQVVTLQWLAQGVWEVINSVSSFWMTHNVKVITSPDVRVCLQRLGEFLPRVQWDLLCHKHRSAPRAGPACSCNAHGAWMPNVSSPGPAAVAVGRVAQPAPTVDDGTPVLSARSVAAQCLQAIVWPVWHLFDVLAEAMYSSKTSSLRSFQLNPAVAAFTSLLARIIKSQVEFAWLGHEEHSPLKSSRAPPLPESHPQLTQHGIAPRDYSVYAGDTIRCSYMAAVIKYTQSLVFSEGNVHTVLLYELFACGALSSVLRAVVWAAHLAPNPFQRFGLLSKFRDMFSRMDKFRFGWLAAPNSFGPPRFGAPMSSLSGEGPASLEKTPKANHPRPSTPKSGRQTKRARTGGRGAASGPDGDVDMSNSKEELAEADSKEAPTDAAATGTGDSAHDICVWRVDEHVRPGRLHLRMVAYQALDTMGEVLPLLSSTQTGLESMPTTKALLGAIRGCRPIKGLTVGVAELEMLFQQVLALELAPVWVHPCLPTLPEAFIQCLLTTVLGINGCATRRSTTAPISALLLHVLPEGSLPRAKATWAVNPVTRMVTQGDDLSAVPARSRSSPAASLSIGSMLSMGFDDADAFGGLLSGDNQRRAGRQHSGRDAGSASGNSGDAGTRGNSGSGQSSPRVVTAARDLREALLRAALNMGGGTPGSSNAKKNDPDAGPFSSEDISEAGRWLHNRLLQVNTAFVAFRVSLVDVALRLVETGASWYRFDASQEEGSNTAVLDPGPRPLNLADVGAGVAQRHCLCEYRAPAFQQTREYTSDAVHAVAKFFTASCAKSSRVRREIMLPVIARITNASRLVATHLRRQSGAALLYKQSGTSLQCASLPAVRTCSATCVHSAGRNGPEPDHPSSLRPVPAEQNAAWYFFWDAPALGSSLASWCRVLSVLMSEDVNSRDMAARWRPMSTSKYWKAQLARAPAASSRASGDSTLVKTLLRVLKAASAGRVRVPLRTQSVRVYAARVMRGKMAGGDAAPAAKSEAHASNCDGDVDMEGGNAGSSTVDQPGAPRGSTGADAGAGAGAGAGAAGSGTGGAGVASSPDEAWPPYVTPALLVIALLSQMLYPPGHNVIGPSTRPTASALLSSPPAPSMSSPVRTPTPVPTSTPRSAGRMSRVSTPRSSRLGRAGRVPVRARRSARSASEADAKVEPPREPSNPLAAIVAGVEGASLLTTHECESVRLWLCGVPDVGL